MCGGMPRPPRIVKHRPRQADEIGVAGADHGFRMLEFRDEPDSYHRDWNRAFHRPRERALVSGSDWNPLLRGQPATRYMNRIAAPGGERLRQGHGLLDGPT